MVIEVQLSNGQRYEIEADSLKVIRNAIYDKILLDARPAGYKGDGFNHLLNAVHICTYRELPE